MTLSTCRVSCLIIWIFPSMGFKCIGSYPHQNQNQNSSLSTKDYLFPTKTVIRLLQFHYLCAWPSLHVPIPYPLKSECELFYTIDMSFRKNHIEWPMTWITTLISLKWYWLVRAGWIHSKPVTCRDRLKHNRGLSATQMPIKRSFF